MPRPWNIHTIAPNGRMVINFFLQHSQKLSNRMNPQSWKDTKLSTKRLRDLQKIPRFPAPIYEYYRTSVRLRLGFSHAMGLSCGVGIRSICEASQFFFEYPSTSLLRDLNTSFLPSSLMPRGTRVMRQCDALPSWLMYLPPPLPPHCGARTIFYQFEQHFQCSRFFFWGGGGVWRNTRTYIANMLAWGNTPGDWNYPLKQKRWIGTAHYWCKRGWEKRAYDRVRVLLDASSSSYTTNVPGTTKKHPRKQLGINRFRRSCDDQKGRAQAKSTEGVAWRPHGSYDTYTGTQAWWTRGSYYTRRGRTRAINYVRKQAHDTRDCYTRRGRTEAITRVWVRRTRVRPHTHTHTHTHTYTHTHTHTLPFLYVPIGRDWRTSTAWHGNQGAW